MMIARSIQRLFKRRDAQAKTSSDQLLRDAGLSVEKGWFGQRVKTVDTPPQMQSQAVGTPTIPPIEARTYPASRDGNGVYGTWTLDSNALPAYAYDLDQWNNRTAYFVNSQGLDRRDHWHQIGNDHVTGLAGNDGVVQVYLADRGGIFLNHYAPEATPPTTPMGRFTWLLDRLFRLFANVRALYWRWRMRDKIIPRGIDPKSVMSGPTSSPKAAPQNVDLEVEFAYTGGFSYLNDGQETWATAQRYAPSASKPRRVFGIGSFETETIYRHIRHTRRVYAPYGDHPFMLTDLEIENQGTTAVMLRCYEYWDVNVLQMRVQWVRSGIFGSHGDVERALINARFQPHIQSERDGQALRFQQQRFGSTTMSAEELAGFVDNNPPEVFLANLSGTALPTVDYFTDKRTFFGSGSAARPDAVHLNQAGKTNAPKRNDAMPYCLVLRHDLSLAPGQTIKLRFAYGAILHPDQPLDFLNPFTSEVNELERTVQAWKKQILYFSNGQSSVLPWEMSWHAYNLLSSTLYSEFYKTHYIPQGSAYLYLHGADGAPRDQSLFALPLVYIRPALARDLLILLMRLRHMQTLALPYSFVGNGAQDNALGLHSKPSDLDLFFMLAVVEYLSATGDHAFLHEFFPLYRPGNPPLLGPELKVIEHIQAAFKHLEDTIGLGPHQLLGIGSGDWDDSIVASRSFRPTFNRERTMKEGESIPNSQMALYVLPLMASLIAPHVPALAARMDALARTLKDAVREQWNAEKKWFYRAWVWERLKGNDIIGNSTLSLQAQIWPLISGLAREMNIEADLIETIKRQLDDDSPTGAMLEPQGQVWPAVSQLLTWGYQRSRPDLAWRSLNRHTFAVHANVFPSIWFNIWTGPDGTNSFQMPNPGGTWASPVTPMTDLPGMNANQDAMALLGLLRVCGIEPSRKGDGLDITPKAPLDRYVLQTELLHLDVAPNRIAGEYHAANEGRITLHLAIPQQAINIVAKVNETVVASQPVEVGRMNLALKFAKGQTILFEVVWG